MEQPSCRFRGGRDVRFYLFLFLPVSVLNVSAAWLWQPDRARVAWRHSRVVQLGIQTVVSILQHRHRYQRTVFGSRHAFKFLNRQVEEAHDEEPYGQPVCHEHAVVGTVVLGEVSVERSQQVVHAVIDV